MSCQPAVDGKPALRAAPRRGSTVTVETTEYAQMMLRMVRAYGRRVADADVEDLADLLKLGDELDAAIARAVSQSRARHGRSWADIARAVTLAGHPITRQAAQKRWGVRV